MKDKLYDILFISICVIVFAFVIIFVGAEFWAIIRYNNKPVSEIPNWVQWFIDWSIK